MSHRTIVGRSGFGKSRIVVADRYSALGIEHPNQATVCRGKCEGTGYVPVSREAVNDRHCDARFAALWRAAEAAKPADDGWHFVVCPDCNGTGKR